MNIVIAVSIVLFGLSGLAALALVGRSALRRWAGRRLLHQAAEIRQVLHKLRESEFAGIDRMLFDMRDTYDLGVLESELSELLHQEHAHTDKLRNAYNVLGLTNRYLRQVRDATSWKDRAKAATALGALGSPEAVEPLVTAMRDKREDSDVKLAAAEALGRIRDPSIVPTLCAQLEEVDEWASPRVAHVLVQFGKDAVEPLLDAIRSSDSLNSRVWSTQVLGKIGDGKAVVPLIRRLHDRSEQMRLSVAAALGDIADNRALRPLVEVILRDPVAAVRAQAAVALGRIGDDSALPLLVTALGDPEYWVRFRALEAIEALEPEDPAPIESALADANPEVRKRAALALERLDRLEHDFVNLTSSDPEKNREARARLIAVGRAGLSERLARHLDDPDPIMRARVAQLLGPVGDNRRSGDLLACLRDDSDSVRQFALRSLGDLAVPGTATSIVPLLRDTNEDTRDEAVEALHRFPLDQLTDVADELHSVLDQESDDVRLSVIRVLAIVPGDEVDDMLAEALNDRLVDVRLEAVRALGNRQIAAAVPAIGILLRDPLATMRTAAADALGRIGGEAAIEFLMGAMATADSDQRDSICATLAQLGFDAVRPLLDVLFASDDLKTRLGAAWTLGKTGDPRAAKVLRLLMHEEQVPLRSSAAGALAKIDCPDSVAALREGTRDPSPFVRSAAINGLGRLGAGEALADLVATLSDPDAFVRNRAAVAIGRLGGPDAHAALEQASTDAIDPAMRLIGLALTQTAEAIGKPMEAMRDPTLRDQVSEALGNEDEAVRVQFFAALQPNPDRGFDQNGTLEPDQVLQRFATAVQNSPDAAVRRRAAAALSAIDSDEAIAALAASLTRDPDAQVRLAAARGLRDHSDRTVAKASLTHALMDPDHAVRAIAVGCSAKFVAPDGAPPIFESLKADDDTLRVAAENALASIFAESVPALHDWMMGQEEPHLLQSGLRILTSIGDADSLGLVSAMLRSEEPQTRVEAARALGAIHVPEAIAAMLSALSDPSEAVRVSVVRSLAGMSRVNVLEGLARGCLDPSLEVRCAVADTLATLKRGKALELLEDLAGDPSPVVVGRALSGLLRHQDADGKHRLVELVGNAAPDSLRIVADATTEVAADLRDTIKNAFDAADRELAVRVFAAVDATRFAADIATALGDFDAKVRLAAIESLATVDPERVGDWLKPLQNDPVSEVRDAARRALFRVV